jgi:hypothetical protein
MFYDIETRSGADRAPGEGLLGRMTDEELAKVIKLFTAVSYEFS